MSKTDYAGLVPADILSAICKGKLTWLEARLVLAICQLSKNEHATCSITTSGKDRLARALHLRKTRLVNALNHCEKQGIIIQLKPLGWPMVGVRPPECWDR